MPKPTAPQANSKQPTPLNVGKLSPETEQQRRDAATIGPADIADAQQWAQQIQADGMTVTTDGQPVYVKAAMVREFFK